MVTSVLDSLLFAGQDAGVLVIGVHVRGEQGITGGAVAQAQEPPLPDDGNRFLVGVAGRCRLGGAYPVSSGVRVVRVVREVSGDVPTCLDVGVGPWGCRG